MKSLAHQAPSPLRTITCALSLLALLVGCATESTWPTAPAPGDIGGAVPAPGAPVSAPSKPSPPPVPPLVTEQRWLEEWFRGTPVVIVLNDVNTLAVDVPLAHSFATGKSSPKPALVAVLDRVATSLHRQPAVQVSIAAPADAKTSNVKLATARAQRVRKHLLSRGVPTTRMIGVGTAVAGTAVELRLLTAPQAIGRVDAATLPAPAAGIKPTSAAPAPTVKR